MQNVFWQKFKKIILLFILLVSACNNVQSQKSFPSLHPTDSLPIVTFTPTVIAITHEPTAIQAVPNLKPLLPFEEYIIYSKGDETWAINPTKLTPVLVVSNLTPRGWSPSNRYWLFTGKSTIYVANVNGSGIRAVYNYQEYKSISPFWLTDDVVLFNAYKDYLLPPDIYRLDINSGTSIQLFPGSNKFIQTTFPSEKKWLLARWTSPNSLYIVDENEKIESFFADFSIHTAPFTLEKSVERINKLRKYLFVAKRQNDTNYKLWLVSKQETPQLLFDPVDESIDHFAISPNEQYVALTYNTLKGEFLYIIDLENFQLLHKWNYPYKLGSGQFIWSPDSQSIVLLYSESDTGTVNGVNFGIQIMNTETGETRTILKEDIGQILDWHLLK